MAGNTLNRVMDRRKKLVRNAPTMKVINQSAFKIAGYKHHLSYGIWMFSALTFVLLFLKAPASNWVPMLVVTLLLGGVYWRWTFLSNQVGDARISGQTCPSAHLTTAIQIDVLMIWKNAESPNDVLAQSGIKQMSAFEG